MGASDVVAVSNDTLVGRPENAIEWWRVAKEEVRQRRAALSRALLPAGQKREEKSRCPATTAKPLASWIRFEFLGPVVL